MTPPFSIGESLKFGWRTMRQHARLMFGVTLLLLACVIGAMIFQFLIDHNESWSLALLWGSGRALFMLVSLVFGIGATIIALKLARGHEATISDIIPSWRLFVQSFTASALFGLLLFAAVFAAVVVSLVAFFLVVKSLQIIVSIVAIIASLCLILYIFLRYSMVKLIAIDGIQPIRGILPKSTRLTMDTKMHLLGFFIVLLLINVLGAICILIGLLLSIPVTIIASAHVYLKLLGEAPSSSGN